MSTKKLLEHTTDDGVRFSAACVSPNLTSSATIVLSVYAGCSSIQNSLIFSADDAREIARILLAASDAAAG